LGFLGVFNVKLIFPPGLLFLFLFCFLLLFLVFLVVLAWTRLGVGLEVGLGVGVFPVVPGYLHYILYVLFIDQCRSV